VKVLVHEGDVIREDAPLLEVETDKAQVEIPSPMSGRVAKVHVTAGQTVKVGAVLVMFDDLDSRAVLDSRASLDSRAPGLTPARSGESNQPWSVASPTAALPVASAPAAVRSSGPVPATPSTRRLARELGVDLRTVMASGPGGRVTDDDVRAGAGGGIAERGVAEQPGDSRHPSARKSERAGEAREPASLKTLEAPPLPNFEQWGEVERQPLSHLRRTIAERMTLSATIVPHVTHFDRADITDLDALITRHLDRAKERGVTLTLTSFLLKAAALALRAHPRFNASLDASAGELVLKHYVNLGVAVATERGLIVPVLRDVDRKPLIEIARELAALAQRTREGKASLDDLKGGTFTVTNIGALGGTGAIPIINYPEVAILAVARGRQEAVVRDGQIVPRLLLPLSLTFDHRVADGADGARFASAIVRLLEHPDELLLEL
jgi:pyruvate dehydrogenase E2 component (dihydrolipoamide acetyltransferase)